MFGKKRLRDSSVLSSPSHEWWWNCNPPSPSSVALDTSVMGQRLSNLWKTLDRKRTTTCSNTNTTNSLGLPSSSPVVSLVLSKNDALRETLEWMQQLISLVLVRGFLQGNVELAQRVLTSTSSYAEASSSASGRHKQGGKQRKNRGGNRTASTTLRSSMSSSNNSNELTMMDTADDIGTSVNGGGLSAAAAAATGTTLDVQLLVTVVTRILETGSRSSSSSRNINSPQLPNESPNNNNSSISRDKKDDALLIVVAMAADLVTAACEYTKALSTTAPSDDPCFLAEYELVASAGKTMLSNMEKTVRHLLCSNNNDNDNDSSADEQEEAMYTVGACWRASSSLISLFGTRLSRSTALIASLRTTAWTALATLDNSSEDQGGTHCSEFAVFATTTLLATLVLTGGTEQQTPSVLWNGALTDATAVLSAAIRHVAPIVTLKNRERNDEGMTPVGQEQGNFALIWNMVNDQWLAKIADDHIEATKVCRFLHLLERFVGYTISLLARDALRVSATPLSTLNVSLLGAEVNVPCLLSLVDTMLVFSMASEAKYYGTKKRLRHESVEGGILSAAALTGHVAIAMRLQGHRLLDSIVTTLGTDSLVPYARRLLKLTHNAVLTSSSSALRRVIEPSSAAQLDGKWQRWLHNSMAARVAAVNSCRLVFRVFGVDARSTSLYGTSTSGNTVERSITIVCGNVIETLTKGSTGSVDWGSFYDQVELVASCTECLAAVLTSGGAYLPMATRELIESVASSCLVAVQKAHPIVSSGTVKASILDFSGACVLTSWQDGAASVLVDLVRSVAHCSLHDNDESVVVAATRTLQACEVVDSPRVPALHVVTRSPHHTVSTTQSASMTITAEKLANQLESVRLEIERVKAQETIETRENASKRAKLTLDAANERAATEIRTSAPSNEPTIVAPTEREEVLEKVSTIEETGNNSKKGSKVEITQNHNEVTIIKEATEEDDDDIDFPSIVDCPPDEEDA